MQRHLWFVAGILATTTVVAAQETLEAGGSPWSFLWVAVAFLAGFAQVVYARHTNQLGPKNRVAKDTISDNGGSLSLGGSANTPPPPPPVRSAPHNRVAIAPADPSYTGYKAPVVGARNPASEGTLPVPGFVSRRIDHVTLAFRAPSASSYYYGQPTMGSGGGNLGYVSSFGQTPGSAISNGGGGSSGPGPGGGPGPGQGAAMAGQQQQQQQQGQPQQSNAKAPQQNINISTGPGTPTGAPVRLAGAVLTAEQLRQIGASDPGALRAILTSNPGAAATLGLSPAAASAFLLGGELPPAAPSGTLMPPAI